MRPLCQLHLDFYGRDSFESVEPYFAGDANDLKTCSDCGNYPAVFVTEKSDVPASDEVAPEEPVPSD